MHGLPVQTHREAVRVFDRRYTARKILRDGTHRTCSPAETWARWRPMAAHFGMTRVASLTGLDIIGVPMFTAVRPNSRSLATSQGKALDPLIRWHEAGFGSIGGDLEAHAARQRRWSVRGAREFSPGIERKCGAAVRLDRFVSRHGAHLWSTVSTR